MTAELVQYISVAFEAIPNENLVRVSANFVLRLRHVFANVGYLENIFLLIFSTNIDISFFSFGRLQRHLSPTFDSNF